MKKVININFQGRVVPIEESAYELLQNYITSLRNYFAREEGRDEIINDIENRIGELFEEKLKKGAPCIADTDVEKVMDSMGRPEDFAGEDAAEETGTYSQQTSSSTSGYQQAQAGPAPASFAIPEEKKRLYRDEQDKILGGVASGLANYMNIDPAIIRIAFALLALFVGSGFLIYLILWIVLPSRSLVNNVRKRLFRDPDDKVVAGVAGGLAKYFNISPAILRIIFAAPFILAVIAGIGHNFFFRGFVFTGSFGGWTFFLVYLIFWLVLPEAHTASEKLEMKGEKVDLNSIRDTIMNDLQGVKGRAEKAGQDIKASAERMGGEMKSAFQERMPQFANEVQSAAKRNSGGLGNAIGIIVKAFLLFILGSICMALFVGLIALLGSGITFLPFKELMLKPGLQSLLAWGTLLFFIGVPIFAFITWVIRRLMRVKSKNSYIAYSYSILWVVGWVCVVCLAASLTKDFSMDAEDETPREYVLQQPSGNNLIVKARDLVKRNYYSTFFDNDNFEGVLSIEGDSAYINTVRVYVAKSPDSQYHVSYKRLSHGRDGREAIDRLEKISFNISQRDSLLVLPESFAIGQRDRWRNQRVVVRIEVPVGQFIRLDESLRRYDYFSIERNRNRRWNWRITTDGDDESWMEHSQWHWDPDVNLQMGADGELHNLKREEKERRRKEGREQNDRDRDGYRYNDEDEEQDPELNRIPSDTIAPKPARKDTIPAKKDSTYRYNQARVSVDDTESNDAGNATAQNTSVMQGNPLQSILQAF